MAAVRAGLKAGDSDLNEKAMAKTILVSGYGPGISSAVAVAVQWGSMGLAVANSAKHTGCHRRRRPYG